VIWLPVLAALVAAVAFVVAALMPTAVPDAD
jgi:hypothetical protein